LPRYGLLAPQSGLANPTADVKPLPENKRNRLLAETELAVICQALLEDDFGRIASAAA